MKSLSRMLTAAFRPAPAKNPDTHRKAREEAKKLAAEHGIEIERFKPSEGGGMNVWPPKGLPDSTDPYDGDHFCLDWSEALAMVQHYANMVEWLGATDLGAAAVPGLVPIRLSAWNNRPASMSSEPAYWADRAGGETTLCLIESIDKRNGDNMLDVTYAPFGHVTADRDAPVYVSMKTFVELSGRT